MDRVLRWILRLSPPAFRSEFGDEMAAVFRQSAAERRAQGRLALAAWLLAELSGGLQVALRLRFNALKQGAKMETFPSPNQNDRVPPWVIPAMLVFFLFPSLSYLFYALFPGGKVNGLPVPLAILCFIGLLVAGLRARLPRWSLLFTGVVLGVIGFYVFFTIMAFLAMPVLLLLAKQSQGTLAGTLFYEWVYKGLTWLGIGLANGLFLAFVAKTQGRHGSGARFWQDLSLLSFSLYGSLLIVYLIEFDEYQHEELYVFISMAALALGAWGYLRAKSPAMRTLALLAGLTVCLASMGVGKYYLVPLQEWGPWLQSHPPESERWFEALRTIAIWFWAALFVGLPGLVQALRKPPPDQPTQAAQAAE